MVWHSKLGSTTLIRRRQLEIADTIEGVEKACIMQVWNRMLVSSIPTTTIKIHGLRCH